MFKRTMVLFGRVPSSSTWTIYLRRSSARRTAAAHSRSPSSTCSTSWTIRHCIMGSTTRKWFTRGSLTGECHVVNDPEVVHTWRSNRRKWSHNPEVVWKSGGSIMIFVYYNRTMGLLPSAKKLRRLCFYRRVSVHRGVGGVCFSACWDTTPPTPSGADPPTGSRPPEQTPPWSRHPPRADPPPPGADTPREHVHKSNIEH